MNFRPVSPGQNDHKLGTGESVERSETERNRKITGLKFLGVFSDPKKSEVLRAQ